MSIFQTFKQVESVIDAHFPSRITSICAMHVKMFLCLRFRSFKLVNHRMIYLIQNFLASLSQARTTRKQFNYFNNVKNLLGTRFELGLAYHFFKKNFFLFSVSLIDLLVMDTDQTQSLTFLLNKADFRGFIRRGSSKVHQVARASNMNYACLRLLCTHPKRVDVPFSIGSLI